MPKRRRFGPVLIPGSPTTPPPSSDEEEDEEEDEDTEPTRTPMDVAPCAPCDEEEAQEDAEIVTTPAGRRLKPCAGQAGVYEDVDDGQKFKVQKIKGGDQRFVPILGKRMVWKTSEGFKAMLLLLSCLGKEGEYVLVNDEVTKAPMNINEWKRRKYGFTSKPPVWHKYGCGQVVTSTVISSFAQGVTLGCRCHNTSAKCNMWKNRRQEIVAIGRDKNFVVVHSDEEWIVQCSGVHWCPMLQCTICQDVVTSTCIDSLANGQNIGCRCHNSSAQSNIWKNRRCDVADLGTKRNFTVLTDDETWASECTNVEWCPTLQCHLCDEVVRSTSIKKLRQGQLGCRCNSNFAHANLWKNRRHQVVEWGKERNFAVETTHEDWLANCTGANWFPSLRCTACGDKVNETRIADLQQGGGIGCNGCRKKTEKKLHNWLNSNMDSNNVEIVREFPGPATVSKTTKFDFLLRSKIDDYCVIIELDGPQHFWQDHAFFTEAGCERDLKKEIWANERDICVIRLLAKDVWFDRHQWVDWLKYLLCETRRQWAADAPARVFCAPEDAPEYTTDPTSAYVRYHSLPAPSTCAPTPPPS